MTDIASGVRLELGDCMDVLREMEDCSVDSVVTDPPYGLSFMGKKWDYDVPSEDIWRECLRVLKPGGHLLAFAGTRTQHRMAVRIEDAGFEIRDMIAWVYGSGFPKSLNVGKAIDKAAGAEREVVGVHSRNNLRKGKAGFRNLDGDNEGRGQIDLTTPATEGAKQWEGWGTALKPALEPITVARKPFPGTVAANVLEHGTGAINVDGCRVGYSGDADRKASGFHGRSAEAAARGNFGQLRTGAAESETQNLRAGRWPANLIHDGSDEVVGLFPVTKERGNKGVSVSSGERRAVDDYGLRSVSCGAEKNHGIPGDSGSAARFFYCAKANKKDREGSTHPTMKPTDLMRYLCRLVTPPGGTVLDPFMGSGSTGKAAVLEGFQFIGIERELEYLEIATSRIAVALPRQLQMET